MRSVNVFTKSLLDSKCTTLLLSGNPQITHSRIDEPVYFLDEGSLWEHFQFRSIEKSNKLATLSKNGFQWNPNQSRNFYERRGNFQNITLFGVTEVWTTYNYLTNQFKKEDHVSQTILNTHEVKYVLNYY